MEQGAPKVAAQAICEGRAAAIMDEHEGRRSRVVMYKLRIGAHATEQGEWSGVTSCGGVAAHPSVWVWTKDGAGEASGARCGRESWRASNSVASVVCVLTKSPGSVQGQ